MSKKKKRGQLLVEGKNDQHVVWALCQQYKVPKTFTVEIPGDVDGGIEELLAGIPLRLKSSNLAALEISDCVVEIIHLYHLVIPGRCPVDQFS